jgi:hypothetical protein
MGIATLEEPFFVAFLGNEGGQRKDEGDRQRQQ